jgi:uncharacterized membrane protein YhaH (DUF805 family)
MFKFLNIRTNRATYWFSIALVVALLTLASWIFPDFKDGLEVPLVLVGVPRLHDIGRTGWFALVLIPLEIGAAALAITNPPLADLAFVGVTLVFAGLVIWLGAIPGQSEANRFGERPAPGIDLKRRPKAVRK